MGHSGQIQAVRNTNRTDIGREGVNWIQLARGLMTASCEHGNEISGSIQDGKYLDQLSYYRLLKDSAQCTLFVEQLN
jgi:hypothetical protein